VGVNVVVKRQGERIDIDIFSHPVEKKVADSWSAA
jgi:hypothetical protein